MTTINDQQLAQWGEELAVGLGEMKIDLNLQQRNTLVNYLALLNKWNKAYNLTAVRDPEMMVSRQLLDSLSILPWIKGPRILDVGTGAGLPGIPLAIAIPEFEFALLDSNGKKTRFIKQAVHELGLKNVSVIQDRVEAVKMTEGFDTIVSRAFADLHLMLKLTAHLRKPDGQWAAMKASLDEIQPEILAPELSLETHVLSIPEETGQRHLVLVS